ncbi:MAG TPA: FAD-binding oxidoreductase [Patescibacteria group bacterium]|nr:FAD-binding oxidoreductase [Patescibacteria group bacterium]
MPPNKQKRGGLVQDIVRQAPKPAKSSPIATESQTADEVENVIPAYGSTSEPTVSSSEPDLKPALQTIIKGEVDSSPATLELYSHDASMFELMPRVVVAPKDAADIKQLVRYVTEQKSLSKQHISLTARSGGTDMGGGAISQSIVMDMSKHFNRILEVNALSAHVQPGVYYRDFEPETLKYKAWMPSFPASREICTVGGMVANNSGGELSLRYGKTEKFIEELKVVLSDGNEYTIKPLGKKDLDDKMAQKDFEGELYRKVFELVDTNYDEIKDAKPKVSKDSTAYHLWNVWDRETGKFDLTQVIVGSQGTLGIVTDIKFRLVPKEPYGGVLVCFLKNMDGLGDIINTVMTQHPTSFESFDNYTLNLSIKFFPYFRKNLGWKGLFKLGLQLIPDAFILLRGIPKLILLVEFTGQTQEEVTKKIDDMRGLLKHFNLEAMEEDETEAKAWKFRIMRRESFNLLRKKVKDKHTAPFIDDLVVPPPNLPQFLPKLREIVNSYKLMATVAGHMGDGNFHVIPLMKIEDKMERIKLAPAMREVNELVLKYGGSISGEHNDGMIRGPWLYLMYSKSMMVHFKELKSIFDPLNIFNPDKKTDAHWEFTVSHIRQHF